MEFLKTCFFYIVSVVTRKNREKKIITIQKTEASLAPRNGADTFIKSDYYINQRSAPPACCNHITVRIVCGMPIPIEKNNHP